MLEAALVAMMHKTMRMMMMMINLTLNAEAAGLKLELMPKL
jgi:hypothetical protein